MTHIVMVTETIMSSATIVAASTSPATAADAATTDERDRLVTRIAEGVGAVASHHRCITARHLHRAGISMAHLQVLWILAENGPLAISRLADLIGVALPNATGLIDRMEQRGLVTRERVPGDRRVVLIRTTDAGLDVVDTLDGWRVSMFEHLFAHFDARELERVEAAIEDVRSTFALEDPSGAAAFDADPCASLPTRRTGAAAAPSTTQPKETPTR